MYVLWSLCGAGVVLTGLGLWWWASKAEKRLAQQWEQEQQAPVEPEGP